MKKIAALTLALALPLSPVSAQEDRPTPDNGMSEGIDLLGEGMRLFFKGLGDKMEPAMRDLAEAMEPAMRELMRLIDDIDAYEMPEKLPNGDIIIRRKTPPVPPPGDGGEVDI